MEESKKNQQTTRKTAGWSNRVACDSQRGRRNLSCMGQMDVVGHLKATKAKNWEEKQKQRKQEQEEQEKKQTQQTLFPSSFLVCFCSCACLPCLSLSHTRVNRTHTHTHKSAGSVTKSFFFFSL